MQQQQQPFTRLNCACIFTERAKNIDASVAIIERAIEKKHHKDAIAELKREVLRLKEDHRIHVEEHNKEYMRSMMELSKNRVINPFDGGAVLQTSAWKPGDTNRLRNPPKKRTKKEEAAIKKKANKKQKLKKEK